MSTKSWIGRLFFVTGMLTASEASARTIYVSGGGSDANDGTAAASAFRSISAAAGHTAAGDVVEVDDGVYGPFSVTISGTDAAWIRYVAKAGAKPQIQSTAWNAIDIESAHYIEIRGFEVVGAMASRTLDQCAADADAASPDPLCNGNGISIDSRNVADKAHHILIDGNDVHDCPGGGISAIEADYVTVDDNFVHGNALHTRYGASGISYLTSWNYDTTTGVKMIVRRNRVFANMTLVKWVQIGKLSDGNGIIIDTSRNTGTNPPIAPYTGRFLVEDNLSVGNGGSGIHAYDSDHVDIVQNTTYQNGQVVGYAEIFANNSGDVRIFNNIMIGRADGGVNTNDPKSTATYDFNLYFRGKVNSMGPDDIVADPRVILASLDPGVADLRLGADSPAIDTGTSALASSVDITGAARPWGNGQDRGAYEFLGSDNDAFDAGGDGAGGGKSDAGLGSSAPGTDAETDAEATADADVGVDAVIDAGPAGAAAGSAPASASRGGCGCTTAGTHGSSGAVASAFLTAFFGARRWLRRKKRSA